MDQVQLALIGRLARQLKDIAREIEEITGSPMEVLTNGAGTNDFLPLKEVSRITGLHVTPLRKRIFDKEVPAELLDGRWMIRRSDLHLIKKKRTRRKTAKKAA